MLAVTRALMVRPRLMLLDEPSFGLALLVVRDLFKIFARINREDKVTSSSSNRTRSSRSSLPTRPM
jgi:branched-chain amino acid transport system ATP-binding protein